MNTHVMRSCIHCFQKQTDVKVELNDPFKNVINYECPAQKEIETGSNKKYTTYFAS